MADTSEISKAAAAEEDETRRRFEQLERRQARQRRLRLLLWLLPLALALLLLLLAENEATLVEEGVQAAAPFKNLQREVGDTKTDLTTLGLALGSLERLPPAGTIGETPTAGRAPASVVDVLDFHAKRLEQLESEQQPAAPESEPTPAPGPAHPPFEDAAETHQQLASDIAASGERLEEMARELATLSSAADLTNRLQGSLDAANESLSEIHLRIERLEREGSYRSLTVREKEVAAVLTLGLRIAPGTVDRHGVLPQFSITTRGGEAVSTLQPSVELNKENSFRLDDCSYTFEVTRHKKSWFFDDYLDIELVRSCGS